ncbi:unnamed protein product [Bemisia tabaci]|uniref:Uncharacterized protein n=1 Tax=Bemisia tabaci TaxID=7038 RepID=A0A9P0A0C6_BEMTA|nr:unnamed protein product [Bemisia tabaci]
MFFDAKVVCFLVFVVVTGSGFVLAAAAVSHTNLPKALPLTRPEVSTDAVGEPNSEASHLSAQSRDAAYFMPTGISALGALLFLKVKAVLVVLVAVIIIGLLSKVAGGYGGVHCGGGPMCPQIPHSAEYPPSGHTAYREDYFPHYEPTATGPYSRSSESQGVVSRMLNTVNVVDLGFAVLDIPSDECRRRLVCEMDNSAIRHPPLAFLLDTFRENLSKYREETTTDGMRNCGKLYAHCDTWFPLTVVNASMPG